MNTKSTFQPQELQLSAAAGQTISHGAGGQHEIINLQAILGLPKGTEHFISDIHGEYEAFLHILTSCSGVIKEKVDDLFAATISRSDRDELCTLIYYPEEKLEQLHQLLPDMMSGTGSPCTGSSRSAAGSPPNIPAPRCARPCPGSTPTSSMRCCTPTTKTTTSGTTTRNIISTIIDIGRASNFLVQLCELIKRLAVDHLHVVGDIFDRGPRADIILDSLLDYHSVDIQWGNHDVLWMGAASGSRTLVATVLANSLRYNNLEVIETGYGISLRPCPSLPTRSTGTPT